jgi:hypothetical protein
MLCRLLPLAASSQGGRAPHIRPINDGLIGPSQTIEAQYSSEKTETEPSGPGSWNGPKSIMRCWTRVYGQQRPRYCAPLDAVLLSTCRTRHEPVPPTIFIFSNRDMPMHVGNNCHFQDTTREQHSSICRWPAFMLSTYDRLEDCLRRSQIFTDGRNRAAWRAWHSTETATFGQQSTANTSPGHCLVIGPRRHEGRETNDTP